MKSTDQYIVKVSIPKGMKSIPVRTIASLIGSFAEGAEVDVRPIDVHTELRIVTPGAPISEPSIEQTARHRGPLDSSKVDIAILAKDYHALVAREPINRGETIAVFDGRVFQATHSSCAKLPNEGPEHFGRHAIQIGKKTWRDSNGFARYANHSCEPNCGIKDEGTIFATEYIAAGKELTWAYWMTEDPDERDLKIECLCRTSRCLGWITGFRDIPPTYQERYRNAISNYLRSVYFPD
jgi:hypothetical protein